MSKTLPSTLAFAAATLFLGACDKKDTGSATPDDATAAASDAKIKCFGANECSGQGACDVPDGRVAEGSTGHDCAGHNECKGKGWVLLTQSECDAKGGEKL